MIFSSDSGHPLLGSLLPVRDGAACAVLAIAEGGRLSEPVEHRAETSSAHIFIQAGARSETTVVISLMGNGSVQYDVEIILEDEAVLNVLCLQDCSASSQVSIRQRTRIGNGAKLTLQNITLGGKETAHDLVSAVAGNDATSSVDWMFYGKGAERQTLSARNVFDGRNGAGEILMKGVAQGKAHTKANGLIEIGLTGGGTNTYLTQDVLMLDASAKVDAVPGLEIKTNDVKASHSATVSRVTAEDLFYFAARGIPHEEARRMYIVGFLGQILSRIHTGNLRQEILEKIERKYSLA